MGRDKTLILIIGEYSAWLGDGATLIDDTYNTER